MDFSGTSPSPPTLISSGRVPHWCPFAHLLCEGDLFRAATLLWSVPVSRGYGRRMRYLVMDESNNKLIGLFALGDPVFNLKSRDVRGSAGQQRLG